MHRTALWIVLSLLVLAGCSANPPRAGGRPGDVVSGEGVTRYDILSVDVRVSDEGGVTGYFRTRNTTQHKSFLIEGPATCLNVVGNHATIGGVLERLGGDEFPNPSRYQGWLLIVEDNAGRGVPDKLSHQWLFENPVVKCPTPDPKWTEFQMTEGHVAVVEGWR